MAEDAVDLLTSALSGNAKRPIANAIQNVHAASAAALQALDPRFHVKTSFVDGRARTDIEALTRASFSFHVPAESAQAWQAGMDDLLNHATSTPLPLDGVNATRSPLVQQILEDAQRMGAKFSISPATRRARARITVSSAKDGPPLLVEDVTGELSPGLKTFRFEGKGCEELLILSARLNIASSSGASECDLRFALDKWNGRDVRSLPHFSVIHTLVRALADGWRVGLAFYVDGEQVTDSELRPIGRSLATFGSFRLFLDYTNEARQLARVADTEIKYDASARVDAEDLRQLNRAVQLWHEKTGAALREAQSKRFLLRLSPVDAETVKLVDQLLSANEPSDLTFHQTEDDLCVFGSPVSLPLHRLEISSVWAKAGTPTPAIAGALDWSNQVLLELTPASPSCFITRTRVQSES